MTQPRKATWPATLLKRNGREVPFDPGKIERAIAAAGQATGEFDPQQAQALAERVVERLPERACLDIERVQDLVERVLMEAGHYPTARAYVVYRERHGRLRRERKTLVDVAASMNEYLSREDWRVRANANQGYSLGGLILNVSGKVTANYWLDEVYDADIAAAHRDADLHIHDLDMLAGYCAGWSLRTLLNEGLNGVPGRVEAGPPKHLGSALGQMVNFLGTLQNEWAGAQAFSSFDTYLAPYVRKDRLDYASVRQALQEFIYNLNVPSRWGTQTPFTNLTFDWVCPDDLRDQVPRIGGEEMPFAYGELQAEMDLINRAYIEVMQAGDAHGRVFTFPIPTYNITHDFPWDSDNATRLFEMTARYGLPYFQNFLNSDMQPNQVRSMCCRLQLDVRELLKRGNGLFGSAEQTGSLGVVTINCARLGYRHRGDAAGLYRQLDHLLELAFASLELKRKVIQQHMDAGLYPYTRRYLGTLRNHFSTIGVNGLHEMVRNFSDDREGLHSEAGREMALALLDHVRAAGGFPGGQRAPLQPGSHARRGHHLSLRPRGPQALSAHPPGRHAGGALLHQLLATAGGLHRRPVRGAGAAGRPAMQVHRRHRAASLHGRADFLRRSLQDPGAHRPRSLPPAVPDRHPHLLDLPAARLPGRRARVLPEVRRGAAATLHAQELLRRLRRLSRLSFLSSTSKEYHR